MSAKILNADLSSTIFCSSESKADLEEQECIYRSFNVWRRSSSNQEPCLTAVVLLFIILVLVSEHFQFLNVNSLIKVLGICFCLTIKPTLQNKVLQQELPQVKWEDRGTGWTESPRFYRANMQQSDCNTIWTRLSPAGTLFLHFSIKIYKANASGGEKNKSPTRRPFLLQGAPRSLQP